MAEPNVTELSGEAKDKIAEMLGILKAHIEESERSLRNHLGVAADLALEHRRVVEDNRELRVLLRSIIQHWHEFGPDGMDELITHMDKLVDP